MYRTWLASIRAILRSDQLTGSDAFYYVYGRLEPPQQTAILHLCHHADDNGSWDPEIIFSFFKHLYRRFDSLVQGDEESPSAYIRRFERLLDETKAIEWPDMWRVSTLHRGLRSDIRRVVEDQCGSLFELTYDEYIEQVFRANDPKTCHEKPAMKRASRRILEPSTDLMD